MASLRVRQSIRRVTLRQQSFVRRCSSGRECFGPTAAVEHFD